jgi:hypothetical protein
MPFTLTFDANQEASARKYYARKYPEPPAPIVVVAPTPKPANPVPVKCPTVSPPVCQRGYEVRRTGNVTNANGCVTPVYSCQLMPSMDIRMMR